MSKPNYNNPHGKKPEDKAAKGAATPADPTKPVTPPVNGAGVDNGGGIPAVTADKPIVVETPAVKPVVTTETDAAPVVSPVTPAAKLTGNPMIDAARAANPSADQNEAGVTDKSNSSETIIPPNPTPAAVSDDPLKNPMVKAANEHGIGTPDSAPAKDPSLVSKTIGAVKENAGKGLAFIGAAAGKKPEVALVGAAVLGLGGLWVTVKSFLGKGKVDEETGEIKRPSVLKRAAGVVLGAAVVAGGAYLSKSALQSENLNGAMADKVRSWTSIVQRGAGGIAPGL